MDRAAGSVTEHTFVVACPAFVMSQNKSHLVIQNVSSAFYSGNTIANHHCSRLSANSDVAGALSWKCI